MNKLLLVAALAWVSARPAFASAQWVRARIPPEVRSEKDDLAVSRIEADQ